MTSLLDAPPAAGAQRPRFAWRPSAASSAQAQDAIALAAAAGLVLDDWQAWVLTGALAERSDGRWAAREVGLVVPRQNGKGALLEARELAGLFILGERFITHSAHQFDTSLEAFRRLLMLIESTPELDARVRRVARGHGEEGIEVRDDRGRINRIRFRTRTRGGGRGFSGELLILDEAMFLPTFAHGALMPTLSAMDNPQVWYTGSAVDQQVHDHGEVLARIRERGLAGGDEGLFYAEWSADAELGDEHTVEHWAQANPALGIRIDLEHVALEQRSMDPRTFAVERLDIGDWPTAGDGADDVISREAWAACEDPASVIRDPVALAFDVRPDRQAACIAAAGLRDDGRLGVEVVDHRPGTGWLPRRLVDLRERHQVAGVACDERSPAAALLKRTAEAGLAVDTLNAPSLVRACGAFVDRVRDGTLAHLGTGELRAAVRGAQKRPLGDAWAWSRRSSLVDICPLVAVTLAAYELDNSGPSEPLVAWR